MQRRDEQIPCNLPFEHVSRVAATNDGTLNAIVNKSVCSVDVPLRNAASHHEDEMLSWLHYPVVDSLDRGYCSDIFGDLPKSSAQLVRHSLNELGLRPQNGPFSTGTSTIFSGTLSHEKQGAATSINTCSVLSKSTKEAMESCGSGPMEASFRVAGADAVSDLGACQAVGLTSSHMDLEVYSKLDSQGGALIRVEKLEQPTCERALPNETLYTQSKSSQTLSQVTSQQEGSFVNMTALSCLPKPLDVVNCYIPTMSAGKHMATNFALFSQPAVESKASLHVLGENSGPTNIERVRQQTGQHGMFLESPSTCTMHMNLEAAQAKWLPSPTALPPLLPLPPPLPPLLPPYCSSPAAMERNPVINARRSPVLPPSNSVSESRDETNLSRDTVTCSRMSIMSAEKGARTADQSATSPSRCSGSSTERSGKVTENASTKRKPGAGDDSDYQSEYVEEMEATDKTPSNAKRMRTAEMHNQSERKRRVKINDKLKTLQQLIPNGNKPDKASLLDAVIEYIKLLQSQLQTISMRTGIGVPSWMIPNVNMQHVQMPSFTQMRLTSDMGMGVGLGMGMRMGMGMMDANVAAVGTGCTIVPMPLFPGPPPPIPHSGALQPAERMQSPGVMNFYHPLMNQNVPMYNTLQPRMRPQQLQFSGPFQQSPQLPGSAGKRPFC